MRIMGTNFFRLGLGKKKKFMSVIPKNWSDACPVKEWCWEAHLPQDPSSLWKFLLSSQPEVSSISRCWAASVAGHVSSPVDQGAHSVTVSNCQQFWQVVGPMALGSPCISAPALGSTHLGHHITLMGFGRLGTSTNMCLDTVFSVHLIKPILSEKEKSDQMSHQPPNTQDENAYHLWQLP